MSEDKTALARIILHASLDRQNRNIELLERNLALMRRERDHAQNALNHLDNVMKDAHPDPRRRSFMGRLAYLLGGW